jgi:D-aminopeptidase
VVHELRARIRELGVRLGKYAPGAKNAITDVSGVRVGQCTVRRGASGPRGSGVARTGVTAILPRGPQTFHERVYAGCFVLSGAGEVTGLTQVAEWGLVETPILLTSTLAVGRVVDATVKYMLRHFPTIGGEHEVIIPVVGECDDSWLNDVASHPIEDAHVFEALESAGDGPVAEGCVGAGTGMMSFDFAGGVGTSSRMLPGGYAVGVLVVSNFGRLADLRVDGVPVGQLLAPRFEGTERRAHVHGSIVAAVATDAPLGPPQLSRLARRAALAIGRTGSYAAHGSGEIVLAFSTANPVPRAPAGALPHGSFLLDAAIDPFYEAAVEATEEAILNALSGAHEQDGVEGHVAPALPLGAVREIVAAYAEQKEQLRARRA